MGMAMKKLTNRNSQKGVTMVEVLLGLVIFAALSIFVIKMQVQVGEEVKSKQNSESMIDFSDAAANYLLANGQKIVEAMKDGTDASQYCVINANPSTGVGTVANNTTKHTCAVDVSFLKFKKVVPENYSDTNRLKQKWTAIYKLVYFDTDNNPATPDDTDGSVEMLVIGATNGGKEEKGSASEITTAAHLAGYNGGFIPDGKWGGCSYDSSTKKACGAGGGWSVDLNQFIDGL